MPDKNDFQTEFIDQLKRNIKDLESRDGEIIVYDGKFIGPGQKETQNMVKGTTISKTDAEAKTQSLFENSLLGNLSGDIDEDQIDDIVFLYVKKIAEGVLEDM